MSNDDNTGLTSTTLFRIEERLRENERRMADKISELERRREERDVRLDTRLDAVAVHLERNNVLLDEHMRRTANLEGRFEPLELERHRIRIILGFVGALVGASGTILAIMKFVLGKI